MRLQNIQEGVNDPNIFKAIFMIGAPGSGKTYVARQLTAGTGMRTVNVDTVYEWIRNRQSVLGQGFDDEIYKYSGNVTQKQMDLYVRGRLGMMLDGTGRKVDRLLQIKDTLEELGYETMCIYVAVDLHTALDRNDQRTRKVRPSWLRATYDEVTKASEVIQGRFDTFITIDNSNTDSLRAGLAQHAKIVSNFLISAPKNAAAQEWIADQRSKNS